jgi:hypothetical protein
MTITTNHTHQMSHHCITLLTPKSLESPLQSHVFGHFYVFVHEVGVFSFCTQSIVVV